MASKVTRKLYGFYRPHDPLEFGTGPEDPDTGEILPSMTRQSEMDACDIHNILKQYSQQGFEQLVRENAARGQYADITALPDYQESLNIVMAAESAFMALPSQVRDRFGNDPAQMIAFLRNPENQEEAIRLGLAEDKTPVDPPPQKVEIVNPPEPPPPAK